MTYQEIVSAISALSLNDKLALMRVLATQVELEVAGNYPQGTHSIADIAPAHLGGMLKPFSDDDDILGEMLEERKI